MDSVFNGEGNLRQKCWFDAYWGFHYVAEDNPRLWGLGDNLILLLAYGDSTEGE